MASSTDTMKRTPLYAAHVECGAKMVPFGGWEMPVQYTGIVEEHHAVRAHAGLFDISHMGEVLVTGPSAERVLNHLLTNDVSKLAVGQAQYSLMCNETGGILDDLIVYRIEPTVYLLVINASHIEKDFTWMNTHALAAVVLDDLSDKTAALALQGPAALKILPQFSNLPYFHIQSATLAGKPCRVARTGYTGEDGFEIICDAGDATHLWNEILRLGAKPCGLGARDTLRLEACLPLHGNDITAETTPLEAGLDKFVSFDKNFIGRDAISRQPSRKLIAFKMTGKTPPPRQFYPILGGRASRRAEVRQEPHPPMKKSIGEVTSGAPSPTLGCGIGMGYVPTDTAPNIEIEIRGKPYPATIEKKPLYRRRVTK